MTTRKYIEAAPEPGYTARDIVEITGEEERRIVVSFPPGTPVFSVPETLDALRHAYEAGRADVLAEQAAQRAELAELFRQVGLI